MKNCKNCTNAIFDDEWGEYKCKIYKRRIRDINKHADCEKHEQKKEEKKP